MLFLHFSRMIYRMSDIFKLNESGLEILTLIYDTNCALDIIKLCSTEQINLAVKMSQGFLGRYYIIPTYTISYNKRVL